MARFWKRLFGRNPGVSRRSTEEQFQRLVSGVRDYGICLLDPEGHFRTWNAGAEQMTGYRAEEVIGQHFYRLFPDESMRCGWPQHELELVRKSGRFEGEGWRLRRD